MTAYRYIRPLPNPRQASESFGKMSELAGYSPLESQRLSNLYRWMLEGIAERPPDNPLPPAA